MNVVRMTRVAWLHLRDGHTNLFARILIIPFPTQQAWSSHISVFAIVSWRPACELDLKNARSTREPAIPCKTHFCDQSAKVYLIRESILFFAVNDWNLLIILYSSTQRRLCLECV